MALAAGCFNLDHIPQDVDEVTSATDGDATDVDSTGGTSPISTVTGDASASGSPSSGASEGSSDPTADTDPTTGADPADEPPTIDLLIDGAAEPPPIVLAGAVTLTASVADDRGLAQLQVFLDDAPEPLAEVDLAGSTSEQVEVGLAIPDSLFNGPHSVRAVVRDDAMQATASAPIALEVALPAGGSEHWASVSPSKFTSKALAVAVDTIGDVIAVGEVSVSLDGHRSRMMIRKYRGETGELLWQREFPAQKDVATPAGNNIARAVAVDVYDNVYVVGEVDPDGDSKPSRWLGKFTFDGLLAATHVSDEPASRGNGVAVDAAGRIFVVGYRRDAGDSDVATIDAFNTGLAPQWSDIIADAGVSGTRAYGVAIDRHGDVVMVGSASLDQGNKELGLAALYTAAGARPWWKIVASSEPQPRERLFSVAVDADNEYVVVGRRQLGIDTRRLWRLRLDDEGHEIPSEPDLVARCGDWKFEDDTDVCGVALGPLDRTHVAGVVQQASDDLLVKKTKSDWTINLWATAHDGSDHDIDRGLAVAVDADGFAISAGYETGLGLPRWRVSRQHP